MSAPFYRRTRIEELGERHPGLLEFVEERQRRRVPGPEIAAAILEQWDETVSPQVLSNHYVLRVWQKENALAESFRKANEQATVILKIAAESPKVDEAEMAKVLLVQAIMANAADLADSDPLKLLAEQRKRIELEQHDREIQIERERLEHDKKELELKVATLERQREREQSAVQEAVDNAEKDPKVAIERIREIYCITAPGSSSAAGVPGAVGQ